MLFILACLTVGSLLLSSCMKYKLPEGKWMTSYVALV